MKKQTKAKVTNYVCPWCKGTGGVAGMTIEDKALKEWEVKVAPRKRLGEVEWVHHEAATIVVKILREMGLNRLARKFKEASEFYG